MDGDIMCAYCVSYVGLKLQSSDKYVMTSLSYIFGKKKLHFISLNAGSMQSKSNKTFWLFLACCFDVILKIMVLSMYSNASRHSTLK